eukprot:TRINITY_DN6682_c0_g1_i2.p1 TRINITY_DN6682_c0_g1~~TRINITY_DN6682_c0_g1_i2.p1  ORF type:complete len:631 (+),score=167.52 TRINITY_DN6682_c0_g1_i2:109-1893(+)
MGADWQQLYPELVLPDLPTEEQHADLCRLQMVPAMAIRDHAVADARRGARHRLRLVFSLARSAAAHIAAGELVDAEMAAGRAAALCVGPAHPAGGCTAAAADSDSSSEAEAEQAQRTESWGLLRVAMLVNVAAARALRGSPLPALRILLSVLHALERCGSDPAAAAARGCAHLQAATVLLGMGCWSRAWHHADSAAALAAEDSAAAPWQAALVAACIARHLAGALHGCDPDPAAESGIPTALLPLLSAVGERRAQRVGDNAAAAAAARRALAAAGGLGAVRGGSLPQCTVEALSSLGLAAAAVVGGPVSGHRFALHPLLVRAPRRVGSACTAFDPFAELWAASWELDAAQQQQQQQCAEAADGAVVPAGGAGAAVGPLLHAADGPWWEPSEEAVLAAFAAWGARGAPQFPTDSNGPVSVPLAPGECLLASVPGAPGLCGEYVLSGTEWVHRERRRLRIRHGPDGRWVLVDSSAPTSDREQLLRGALPHGGSPPGDGGVWEEPAPGGGWRPSEAAVCTAAAFRMGGDDCGAGELVDWLLGPDAPRGEAVPLPSEPLPQIGPPPGLRGEAELGCGPCAAGGEGGLWAYGLVAGGDG